MLKTDGPRQPMLSVASQSASCASRARTQGSTRQHVLKGHVPVRIEFAQTGTPPLLPPPHLPSLRNFPLSSSSLSLCCHPPHPLQGSSLVLSECRRANAEGQGHGPQPDQFLPGGKKMRSVPWVGERVHQKIAAEKEPALTVLLFLLHQAIQNEKF